MCVTANRTSSRYALLLWKSPSWHWSNAEFQQPLSTVSIASQSRILNRTVQDCLLLVSVEGDVVE
jgi:hypothetical protein